MLRQPLKKNNAMAAKKRNLDGNGDSMQGEHEGTFCYKFKEGHSKNFKRELTIDFFLN